MVGLTLQIDEAITLGLDVAPVSTPVVGTQGAGDDLEPVPSIGDGRRIPGCLARIGRKGRNERIIDEKFDSGAAEDYALAAPLSSPFVGGGLVTVVVIPYMLQSIGVGADCNGP